MKNCNFSYGKGSVGCQYCFGVKKEARNEKGVKSEIISEAYTMGNKTKLTLKSMLKLCVI